MYKISIKQIKYFFQYLTVSDKVIMLTKAECLAHILQNKLTKRAYQRERNKNIRCNANNLLPWKTVMKYRDESCLPKKPDEAFVSDQEYIFDLQDVNNHQLKKLFELQPELKTKMENLKMLHPTARFRLTFKYGKYSVHT